jgi:hypothetical protein
VVAGVWFTSAQVTGPWIIAPSVPTVIYTIPPTSPLYYVTYVRINEATPQYVYVGYTPGYFGTVISPYGTVVYGTGYAYSPWIGTVWYPPPHTYGIAAAPVYNPWVGFTFGFAAAVRATSHAEPITTLTGARIRRPTGVPTIAPARPPTGARGTPATIAMRTAAATSFRTGAAAGSNIPPAAGRARPEITPGPIGNRRRAAPGGRSGVV